MRAQFRLLAGFCGDDGRDFPSPWVAGLAGFSAMLLTCGVIESMWASLADFPGFSLMTLACWRAEAAEQACWRWRR